MKLGVAGMLPHWQKIERTTAERVRAAGFLGASVFIDRPLETDRAAVLRVKAAFDAAGLAVAQANGWYECLVNPDEAVRSEGVRGLQALCRWGRLLGAETIYVRPGSLNPRGHWWPHPGNHTADTFARLVDSLRQVCPVAEREGVVLAAEGHVLSPLDTPRRVADLIEIVASPALKFNVDVVNFIGTVHDAHDPRGVTHELFDVLGTHTVAAHAKDCALQRWAGRPHRRGRARRRHAGSRAGAAPVCRLLPGGLCAHRTSARRPDSRGAPGAVPGRTNERESSWRAKRIILA